MDLNQKRMAEIAENGLVSAEVEASASSSTNAEGTSIVVSKPNETNVVEKPTSPTLRSNEVNVVERTSSPTLKQQLDVVLNDSLPRQNLSVGAATSSTGKLLEETAVGVSCRAETEDVLLDDLSPIARVPDSAATEIMNIHTGLGQKKVLSQSPTFYSAFLSEERLHSSASSSSTSRARNPDTTTTTIHCGGDASPSLRILGAAASSSHTHLPDTNEGVFGPSFGYSSSVERHSTSPGKEALKEEKEITTKMTTSFSSKSINHDYDSKMATRTPSINHDYDFSKEEITKMTTSSINHNHKLQTISSSGSSPSRTKNKKSNSSKSRSTTPRSTAAEKSGHHGQATIGGCAGEATVGGSTTITGNSNHGNANAPGRGVLNSKNSEAQLLDKIKELQQVREAFFQTKTEMSGNLIVVFDMFFSFVFLCFLFRLERRK